jgi:4-aminobutyrate aminotransferase-like enzyme
MTNTVARPHAPTPVIQEVLNYAERLARDVQRTNQDIVVQAPRRLLITAPDGGQWALVVDNSGTLSTEAA